MKPSPLTLHGIEFIRVHIEPDLESETRRADQFQFDGATLTWGLDHGRDEDDGTWWVALGFSTNIRDDEPRCPYVIDMQAVGIFSVDDAYPQDKHEKLAFEFGAALVYGAIREMVSNITARSLSGQLTLPTPNFIGAFEEQP